LRPGRHSGGPSLPAPAREILAGGEDALGELAGHHPLPALEGMEVGDDHLRRPEVAE
jgi:hypothetical protein